MFQGKKCTERCKNSLNILRRQEKAAKLSQCQCQKDEKIDEFNCLDIKINMENLCSEIEEEIAENSTDLNEIQVDEEPPKPKSEAILWQINLVLMVLMAVI